MAWQRTDAADQPQTQDSPDRNNAAQTGGQGSGTGGNATTDTKPLNLPVSLDKIREALQQPPTQPLKGLDEQPQFHVEITERQKLDELLKSLKADSGPPIPGGLYAYQQQQVVFPKVQNPLVQPYAAFSQGELLVVSLTSLIERYLAGRVIEGVTAASRAAAEAAARQEVAQAIAAYCSAQPNGGARIRICSDPLK